MNENDFVIHEKARGDVYRFLSQCYRGPDHDLIEKVNDLQKAADIIDPGTGSIFPSIEKLNELLIDHSQLFVGPFKLQAPPYGSVYLEGERKVMGNSTLDAIRRYKAAGLDISDDHKESPDHITVELEFMYYLIHKELQVIKQADIEGTLDNLNVQVRFLQDHLGAWVPGFSDNIEQNTGTGFYKNLAGFTRAFIEKDMADLRETIDGLSS
ncbi:MAG: molecular chaperone TorD family protein [ANME-2 cluster archaeon]|nr:molecular chaperone TorD family protein [ANME-2 cluster archaeon]